MSRNNSEEGTRDITLCVQLEASPEEVFHALTEGSELMKWIAPEARVTAPSGGKQGKLWISWGEGMAAETPIDVFDPPRRLRLGFGEHPETKALLWADWSIEANPGSTTTLRLVHSGFSASAEWDGDFASNARGWTLMLENLRHYFARHAKQPAEYVAFTAQVAMEHTAVWTALLAKRAMGFDATPRPGDGYRITTSGGAVLSGVVQLANGRDLALTVRELDDALLRVTLEGGSKPGSATYVYGYVIAYGNEAGRARELAHSMSEVISTLG